MYPDIIYEVFVPKHQYLRSWISGSDLLVFAFRAKLGTASVLIYQPLAHSQ